MSDSFTLKETVTKILEEQRDALTKQARIVSNQEAQTKMNKQILEEMKSINHRVSATERLTYLAMGAIVIIAPILGWALVDYIEFKNELQSSLNNAVAESMKTYLELEGYTDVTQ